MIVATILDVTDIRYKTYDHIAWMLVKFVQFPFHNVIIIGHWVRINKVRTFNGKSLSMSSADVDAAMKARTKDNLSRMALNRNN